MSQNVIIIGGGLGGLAAGVALMQKGHEVTLFEKEPHCGGYAIAYKRQGFTFDTGLHAVPGGAEGAIYSDLIRELGIDDAVNFIRFNRAPYVKLGADEYDLPNDFAELIKYLSEKFPADKKGLDRFAKEMRFIGALYSDVIGGRATTGRIITQFVPRVLRFLKHAGQPTDVYLARFFSDVRLKSIVYQASIFYGIAAENFPAVNFIIMFYMMFVEGFYSIKGGGQEMTDALVARFTACGGIIRTKTPVKNILSKRGIVTGVRLADGTEETADAVVGAINTPYLIRTMLGEQHVPLDYLETLSRLNPSTSLVQLHLGLDCPVQQAGIHRHSTGLFPEADVNCCIARQQEALFPEGVSIVAAGIDDPTRQNTVLKVEGGVSAPKWFNLNGDAYREAKRQCTEAMIQIVCTIYPDVAKHIVTTDLCTPQTFTRYSGNPYGAIMGFDAALGAQRRIMKISKVPVKGLYLAGAWTDNLGGFLQSMRAGVIAAGRITK